MLLWLLLNCLSLLQLCCVDRSVCDRLGAWHALTNTHTHTRTLVGFADREFENTLIRNFCTKNGIKSHQWQHSDMKRTTKKIRVPPTSFAVVDIEHAIVLCAHVIITYTYFILDCTKFSFFSVPLLAFSLSLLHLPSTMSSVQFASAIISKIMRLFVQHFIRFFGLPANCCSSPAPAINRTRTSDSSPFFFASIHLSIRSFFCCCPYRHCTVPGIRQLALFRCFYCPFLSSQTVNTNTFRLVFLTMRLLYDQKCLGTQKRPFNRTRNGNKFDGFRQNNNRIMCIMYVRHSSRNHIS